jgi:peptidoglycan hydrolase-like protein with peptidoglycan-binding domain
MKNKFACFLVLTFLSTTTTFASASTTATSTVDICKVINSINIYNIPSMMQIQKFLQQTFFPNIKVTGYNDKQTKYYIGKFQYAFGLKPTGVIDAQTIKFLKTSNNCFDLEKKVLEIQNATVTAPTSALDILYSLLQNYFYTDNTYTNANITVTVATSSTH